MVFSFLHVMSMDDDVGPIRPAFFYLHNWGHVGHHHRGGNVQVVGMVAQGLGVVAK